LTLKHLQLLGVSVTQKSIWKDKLDIPTPIMLYLTQHSDGYVLEYAPAALQAITGCTDSSK
jgi:hypothetical protein